MWNMFGAGARAHRRGGLRPQLGLIVLTLIQLGLGTPALAEPLKFALGADLSTRVGGPSKVREVEPDQDAAAIKVAVAQHNWLLSADIGGRGEKSLAGVRLGFSYQGGVTLLRGGLFIGGRLWRGPVAGLDLDLYTEASLCLDRLSGRAAAFRFVPGLGFGMSAAVAADLRLGLFGGSSYDGYIEHSAGVVEAGFRGDLRATLLYLLE